MRRRGSSASTRPATTAGFLNWPHYEKVRESPQEIAEIRANYAALLAMCDADFGDLLDRFHALDLWLDTTGTDGRFTYYLFPRISMRPGSTNTR
jgi:arylsulfatase A-like enzyme